MEDILAVYARPLDPDRPLVCFDEGGKALQRHVRAPIPAGPGRAAREDDTYARNRAANLFLACAPHLGWRQVWSTEQRTATDFAEAIRWLVDEALPQAETIVLVTDNLHTHTPAAFYKAFPPAEARRLVAKLEWHYTPKHGSWLNMAELELAVLSRQCLRGAFPTERRWTARCGPGARRATKPARRCAGRLPWRKPGCVWSMSILCPYRTINLGRASQHDVGRSWLRELTMADGVERDSSALVSMTGEEGCVRLIG